jgi:hypothetical protein
VVLYREPPDTTEVPSRELLKDNDVLDLSLDYTAAAGFLPLVLIVKM